jgi:hypothetical protein
MTYLYSEDKNVWFCGWFDDRPVWGPNSGRKAVSLSEAKVAAELLGGFFKLIHAQLQTKPKRIPAKKKTLQLAQVINLRRDA